MSWKPVPESTEADLADFARQEKRKARLLVDESLGIGTTEFLRGLGWNVKDVSEVGLSGHPDENVFNFAYKDDRILLTHDEDFWMTGSSRLTAIRALSFFRERLEMKGSLFGPFSESCLRFAVSVMYFGGRRRKSWRMACPQQP
jgi:hypothetical protein